MGLNELLGRDCHDEGGGDAALEGKKARSRMPQTGEGPRDQVQLILNTLTLEVVYTGGRSRKGYSLGTRRYRGAMGVK